MCGEVSAGSQLIATQFVDLAAIGAKLHGESTERIRKSANENVLKVLCAEPSFASVSHDRIFDLLSSAPVSFSRSDLIEASKEAKDIDLNAALANRVYSSLPFDGDDEATKRLVCIALEEGMRVCNADKEFQDEVSKTQLTYVVQAVSDFNQKMDWLIKQSADKARELQLTYQLFICLAKRIADSVPDIDHAYSELERAVEIASQESAQGALPADLDEAIAAIFARVDELNNAGRIDDASAHLIEEEARVKAGLIWIYDKGITQAILTRDVSSACSYEIKKIVFDTLEPTAQFELLRQAKSVWHHRGRIKGLNYDLEVSIALARENYKRANDATQRGKAQIDLGLALLTLGARDSNSERLNEALAVNRTALNEKLRKREPLDWATIQNNIGMTLVSLGMRESETSQLEEAVIALHASLEERTKELVPAEWAETQNSLGTALCFIGERKPSFVVFSQAVSAFQEALTVRSQDCVLEDWAVTQCNLGTALTMLGEWEKKTNYCIEGAIIAFNAALKKQTRDRMPLDWAMTNNNLGNALRILGIRNGDIKSLEESVVHFCNAHEEFKRERVPIDWARTHENLAITQQAIADHPETTNPRSHIMKALTHVEASLEIYDEDQTPFDHGTATTLREELIAYLAK